MSYYARLRLVLEASEYSDYAAPDGVSHQTLKTPDEWILGRLMEIDTSATSVVTSQFSALTMLVVQNTDSTNYVSLTFRSAGNGSTDNIVRIAAGETFVTSDVTAASNLSLTANTAAVSVRVSLLGT